jgi:hypothetical protein
MGYCANLYDTYEQYLKSEDWKLVKEKYIRLDSVCDICGTDKALTLHHISYENCGNEEPEEILCVCSFCHQDLHCRDVMNIKEKYVKKILNSQKWLKIWHATITCVKPLDKE